MEILYYISTGLESGMVGVSLSWSEVHSNPSPIPEPESKSWSEIVKDALESKEMVNTHILLI